MRLIRRNVSAWIGGAIASTAVVLNVATLFDPAALLAWFPQTSGLGLNCMTAFALCGAALWHGSNRAKRVLGLTVMLTAVMVLIQYVFGLVPHDGPWRYFLNTTGGFWPGNMPATAAVAFLAAGANVAVIPFLYKRATIPVAFLLLAAGFFVALAGVMDHLSGLALSFRPQHGGLMSVPSAVGLLLIHSALYLEVINTPTLRDYYQRRPEGGILGQTVVVLLATLLIGGLTASAVMSRQALDAYKRSLAETLNNNTLVLQQAINTARLKGKVALSLATQTLTPQHFALAATAGDTAAVVAVWKRLPDGSSAPLYGTKVEGAIFATPSSSDSETLLLWHDGWILQEEEGDFAVQTKLAKIDALFQSPPFGRLFSDVVLCAVRGDQVVFFSARLAPQFLVAPTRFNADGRLFPCARGQQGEHGVLLDKDYRNAPVIAAYAMLPSFSLGIVQKVDADAVLGPIRRGFWAVLGFLVVTIGLGTALLRLQVKPLTQRLLMLQDSLAQALQRRTLILQNAGEGICGLDADGRVTFINPAGERLLGYSMAELEGRRLHDTVHYRKVDGTPYPIDDCPGVRVLREGIEIRQREELFWRKDGNPMDVDVVSAPVLDQGLVSGAVVVFRDVTEHRRTLKALERWQQIFENAKWGVVVGSADGQVLEMMNPAYADMHGYSVEELTGQPILNVFAPECRADVAEHIRIAHEKGHHIWESWHIRKDGSRFPVQMDMTTVTDDDGRVLYRVVYVQDITERHGAEERIKRSEASLARAQAVAHVGGWQIASGDWGGDQPIEASAEVYRLFEVPQDQLITVALLRRKMHPEDRERVFAVWATAMATGAPCDIEYRILVHSGERWLRGRAEFEVDADGRPIAAIGTVQDVTALKSKEHELLASRQTLRELAAHHEQVREEERGRIAREIHDDLGQYLTALRMDLAFLAIRFGRDNADLQKHLDRMKDTVDTTIGVVRNVATALRPAALDLGLIPAVEWLLGGFEERSGVRCFLEAPPLEDVQTDAGRATAVFRILQESLTNVARHANAGQVWVRIALVDNELVFEVEDDGVGFDPAVVRTKRTFGLMSMRERALMFGGTSRIGPRAAGGTIVSIRIPVTGRRQ